MQFLKILFWCLLAFLAAAFTVGNWTTVPIRLPGGLIADVNLPFLLLAMFLLGLLPTLGWQAARRWRLKQRLTSCERTLAETRALHAAQLPTATTIAPHAGSATGSMPIETTPAIATGATPIAPAAPGTLL